MKEECLVREIREELGCEIRIEERLTPVTHPYPKGTIELIPFRCVVEEGEPWALEHAAIDWLDSSELPRLEFADADVPIVESYVSEKPV